MQRNIRLQPITWKGFFFFLITGLFFIVAQTTLATWVDTRGYGPDFCILMAIYIGMQLPAYQGAPIVALLGFFRDATAGTVLGFYPALYLMLYMTTNVTRQKLDPAAPWHLVIFILTFTIGANLLTWLGLQVFGWTFSIIPQSMASPISVLIISTIMTAVIGPLLFTILGAIKPAPAPEKESGS